jgi:hypothetical protein
MPKRPKHDNFVIESEFKKLENQNWTITYHSPSGNFILECPWGHQGEVPRGINRGAADRLKDFTSKHPQQRH